ncbi:hypothetical protein GCM10027176_53720 [Actinoallomurus bryophytorum]|uniref:DUF4386 family protein n=1 Tax=Actinoallomurus bryophytorum TaxID=1490222 RepID=A0A543BZT5_9ACTN|nr:hypothetical protein [Actinoallomurus bryophytorum]TQL90286.1 hypothetical protein FB559_7587 [Actinoallomurus bryophytorum]
MSESAVAPAPSAQHGRLLAVPAVTGIAYTASWIAGLSVGAPSPALNADGAGIVAAFAGHETVTAAGFVLTEGLPAAGLAVISFYLARATRRSAASTAAGTAGLLAAAISLTQCVLGLVLAGSAEPGTAHLLYEAVNRLDGVKMFALAVLAVAGVASRLLPRWLAYAGVALAVSIAGSGVAYLLLIQGLAVLAYVSGVLLLLFVTATGVVLGRIGR